ncbi:PREDICTED: uncharacterized protein LOC104565854 [Tinamus guttatus]|uniref:uncharacterized protein LOC104565854 n=1 Tax=Tinamus guttatus TaxID=94827 RepID=UPI00052EA2C4|nr:PREDICTED: uncharacterized protein LOC104565854 [Tinamus guttatus]
MRIGQQRFSHKGELRASAFSSTIHNRRNLLLFIDQLELKRKKFVYVEPPRRVKEILEEELYFRKEECHVKHPAAVALEGIWTVKKKFPMGGLKPAPQDRNSLLLQPKFYSRHEGMKRWAS